MMKKKRKKKMDCIYFDSFLDGKQFATAISAAIVLHLSHLFVVSCNVKNCNVKMFGISGAAAVFVCRIL